jgi:hypothetical protein
MTLQSNNECCRFANSKLERKRASGIRISSASKDFSHPTRSDGFLALLRLTGNQLLAGCRVPGAGRGAQCGPHWRCVEGD